MFDVAHFISECESAVATGDGRKYVRQMIAAAVSEPADLLAVFGEPKRAGVEVLHRSPRLTVLHVAWPPSYTQTPHNHLIWAEIGVYSGREDQILWRPSARNAKWPIEVTGGVSLSAGDCHSLDHDAIHSVTNPLDRVTVGLHVYGGDLAFGPPRSYWDGETLAETPFNYERDDQAAQKYNASLPA
jgi:predicted metal-dependent enzyme (double-stranded beta helix superfamily)